MDDDGSKSLSYDEFKKGIFDYGLDMEDDVSKVLVSEYKGPPPLLASQQKLSGMKNNDLAALR